MNNFDVILTEFKDGNDQCRLDLYMNHRDLRSDFDQLENEETTSLKSELTDAQQVVIKTGKIKTQQSHFVRMKRWCFSILPQIVIK
jgi:hypothetical protein